MQNVTANDPNLLPLNGAECPGASVSGATRSWQYTVAPNLWYSNLSDANGPGSGLATFSTATRFVDTFQLVTDAKARIALRRASASPSNGAYAIVARQVEPGVSFLQAARKDIAEALLVLGRTVESAKWTKEWEANAPPKPYARGCRQP